MTPYFWQDLKEVLAQFDGFNTVDLVEELVSSESFSLAWALP